MSKMLAHGLRRSFQLRAISSTKSNRDSNKGGSSFHPPFSASAGARTKIVPHTLPKGGPDDQHPTHDPASKQFPVGPNFSSAPAEESQHDQPPDPGQEIPSPSTRGFPDSEFEQRFFRAQRFLVDAKLDALLLTTEANFYYFTGLLSPFWHSPTRPMYLIVPRVGATPVAVVPSILSGPDKHVKCGNAEQLVGIVCTSSREAGGLEFVNAMLYGGIMFMWGCQLLELGESRVTPVPTDILSNG